jgi:HEAT repeat protein
MNANFTSLMLIASSFALASGCAKSSGGEMWTTKNEPMSSMGTRSDEPTPNMGEALVVQSPDDLRGASISLLLQASESTNALLRANSIEALHHAPGEIEAVVQRGLGDPNRAVRFVAAMTVGELRLKNLTNLLSPLIHDESQSVQAAAIYGLRRCGTKADLNPLSAMLRGEDPEVKGNAALVLGELGDPTAIAMLRDSIGRGLRRTPPARRKIVELQVAEAMVKLGAVGQVDVIRAALFAPAEEGELAALACQMCGSVKDGGALPDLQNLVRRSGRFARPPEVRMAAAQSIAEIDPSRTLFDVPLTFAGSERFELRAQAAHSMGIMMAASHVQNEAVTTSLAKLLEDSNPLVQVSAAGAILRNQAVRQARR